MRAPPEPTAIDPLVALADRCVQCGLCLPACPTYGRERIEAESPRGRIALARAWTLGTVPPTPAGDAHLDHCLACRRCEAVCPAGVRYGELLVEARARQRLRRPAGWRQRAVEWCASRPGFLAAMLRIYRGCHRVLPAAWRPLPRPLPEPRAPVGAPRDAGSRPTAGEAAPARASVFVGCVARAYEPQARAALARLARAAGVSLAEPTPQGCCGSLHLHAGAAAEAERLRIALTRDLGEADPVLTLASGCHDAVAQALPGATRDAFVALDAWFATTVTPFRACAERVALHVPCSQRGISGSLAALRRLLGRIPQLQVIELAGGYGCCGAAGTAMLTDAGRARAYRAPLLEECARAGVTRLLSANIGCRLHLAGGTGLPVLHPLELLSECLLPIEPT